MAIPITRYVDIASGVGGASILGRRQLIGRLFTDNPALSVGSIVSMTNTAEVLLFFGATSEEYRRALFYFAFVSKNITSPQRISFARWVSTAVAPTVIGTSVTFSFSAIAAITNGSLDITMGGINAALTGIDFSGSSSYAACAAVMQTAINGADGDPLYTQAQVTFDAQANAFLLEGGATGAADMILAPTSSGTDMRTAFGWGTGARLSFGSEVETPTEVLDISTSANNDFGSFTFVSDLNEAQIIETALWAQAQNVMFMNCIPVNEANAESIAGAIAQIGGNAVTLEPLEAQYPSMFPMMILAATDYNRRGSVQNYMFQQTGLTASVTDGPTADGYDALRVNYYGATQTNGQNVSFYQRGDMMGTTTDPRAMNVFANEVWLKDAAAQAAMNLLLSASRVPANEAGRAQLTGVIQEVVEEALVNGTISPGRRLTASEKVFIAQQTGDELAEFQVANAGFWLGVAFREDAGETIAVYTLVYAKDNAVRKIVGTHSLV